MNDRHLFIEFALYNEVMYCVPVSDFVTCSHVVIAAAEHCLALSLFASLNLIEFHCVIVDGVLSPWESRFRFVNRSLWYCVLGESISGRKDKDSVRPAPHSVSWH